MNSYLRRKGIATRKRVENVLTFKLYDLDWDLYCENNRISMRCFFSLDEDTRMRSMIKAINKVNHDRYIVKVYLEKTATQDEDGNPIEDAPARTDIAFSFESLCYSESAFDPLYEFAIYAMADAIEYLRRLYHQYLTERNTQTSRIGFHTDSEPQDITPAASNEQSKKRIGFIQ